MSPLRHPQARRQSGAAILMAMLTVVLVATLASAALWQQWRAVEVESAERSRMQATWILHGALDWARLILAEDGRKGGSDNLTEPWAIALEPARLSSFIAADRNDTQTPDPSMDAFLSGQMSDLQARFNVRNLVADGKVHAPSVAVLVRLFALLDLPEQQAQALAKDYLRAHLAAASANGDPQAALLPQDIEQLRWLGLDGAAIDKLRPYITLLPESAPINVNTAPEVVLRAAIPALEQSDAQRLLLLRSKKPWENVTEFRQAAQLPTATPEAELFATQTRFFEIRGSLQIQGRTVHEISVVQRDNQKVKTLWRTRSVALARTLQ